MKRVQVNPSYFMVHGGSYVQNQVNERQYASNIWVIYATETNSTVDNPSLVE